MRIKQNLGNELRPCVEAVRWAHSAPDPFSFQAAAWNANVPEAPLRVSLLRSNPHPSVWRTSAARRLSMPSCSAGGLGEARRASCSWRTAPCFHANRPSSCSSSMRSPNANPPGILLTRYDPGNECRSQLAQLFGCFGLCFCSLNSHARLLLLLGAFLYPRSESAPLSYLLLL
jgi:hypothetical protein